MELTAEKPWILAPVNKLLLYIEEKGNFPLTVVGILGLPFIYTISPTDVILS